MATVIDSLLVELGLDPTKFTQGQKDAVVALKKMEEQATSTAKEMERRGKQAAEFFGNIMKSVAELTAAFLSLDAVKGTVERVIGSESALQALSSIINSSASDIAAWGSAISTTVGKLVDINPVLRSAQEKINEFWVGSNGDASAVTQFQGLTRALQNAGKSVPDSSFYQDYLDPKGDLLAKLGKVQPYIYELYNSGKAGRTSAYTVGHQLGYTDDMIAAMGQVKNFSSLLEKVQKENGITDSGAEKAKEISQRWEHIGNLIRGVGNAITETLYPPLDWVLKHMESILSHVNEWVQANPKIAAGIAAIGVATFTVMGALGVRGLLTRLFGAPAAAEVGAEIGAAVGAGLLARFAGVLKSGLGLALKVGIADAIAGALDPSDDFGHWIERNIPWMSTLNDWFARRGLAAPSVPYAPDAARPGGAFSGVQDWIARHLGLSQATASTLPASNVIDAIIQQESGGRQFDKNGEALTSSKGAIGIMQLTPGAAEDAAKRLGIEYDLEKLKTDAAYNRKLGENEFAWDLNRYSGDRTLALAAYNAGAGNVDKWLNAYGDPRKGGISDDAWGKSIPFKETRDYIKSINSMLDRAPATSSSGPRPDPSLATGARPAAQGATPPAAGGTHTSSNEVNIQTVVVHTAATDGDGVAKSVASALKRHLYANQASFAYGGVS